MRTRVMLAAAVVVVSLATTLALNVVDTGMHVTRASVPRSEIARPDISVPPRISTPVGLTPPFGSAPSVAQRVAPKPAAASPDVEPADPQVAASTTPVADPSTFGSEAYEPIYSN